MKPDAELRKRGQLRINELSHINRSKRRKVETTWRIANHLTTKCEVYF